MNRNEIYLNLFKSFIDGSLFFIQFSFIRKLLTLIFNLYIETDQTKKDEYKNKYYNETLIDGLFASLSVVFVTMIKFFIFNRIFRDNFHNRNIFMAITHSFLWGFFFLYIRKLLLVKYLAGKIDIDIRNYINDGFFGTIAQIVLRLTLEYTKNKFKIHKGDLWLNLGILSLTWSIGFIFIRKSYDFKNLNKYTIDGIFGGIAFSIKTILFAKIQNKIKMSITKPEIAAAAIVDTK